MAKEMKFNLPQEESSIIKVIGVGGGGSNAVNHMYRQGIRGVDFVVCNTDQQALDMSPVPKKIALGSSLTEGRGAGAVAEVGRNAAIENLDDIRAVLENNTKMVFITAGMGGGTGTGAAPIIAELARELGILTVGIVTVPFTFEGKKRRMQAEKGLEELKKHVDTVLVISNDKLREMYGNLKLSEAFHQADDVLTIASKGIAEIITVEGYVNVDFEDVRTVMTNSGVAIMGSATTSGEDRAIKAVEQALASPLLNDNNIYGASNILLYISSGTEEVTMDEVAEITDYIQAEAGMDADVIWGNGTDEELGDKLTLTVIATGFSGEKQQKVAGKDSVVRHVLEPNRQAPTRSPRQSENRSEIPSGLTSRPTLINERLRSMSESEDRQASPSHPNNPANESGTSETPLIRYSLSEDEDEQPSPFINAYKVDESDEQIKQFMDEVAPEMNGVGPDEELPLYQDEDDDETNETPVGDYDTNLFEMFAYTDDSTEQSTESPAEQKQSSTPVSGPTFSLYKDPVSVSDNVTADSSESTSDQPERTELPVSEKPTEVELDIRTDKPASDAPVKRFDLYGPNRNDGKDKGSDAGQNEPRLIERSEQPFISGIDSEEMQRKQQERLNRLRHYNERLRPTNLAELENVPAYKRRNINLTDTPHSAESSVSSFEVKDTSETDESGNKRGGLSDGNEFLHKSVD